MTSPQLRTRRFIDFNPELLEWYEASYGAGSLSWLCNLLLSEFREAHAGATPQLYASMGAKELKRLLDEGEIPDAENQLSKETPPPPV